MKMRYILVCLLLCNLASPALVAQEAVKPRPSPLALVTMKYEDAYVKVTYGQPHKRDRKIFGALVPYGKVWRTGANEATEITVTDDVLIEADTLKAGTYSIFTIPEEDQWTIIFNDRVGQWGAYNYNETYDVLRKTVPVEKLTNLVFEPFTISFKQKNDVAQMFMQWDNVKIALPVSFIDH